MDKNHIHETIMKLKNIPINPLKDKIAENINKGDDPSKLFLYNAMLDNITIGCHTTTIINYVGIDWTLRLLTAEEYINIRHSAIDTCNKKSNYEEYYNSYLVMTKTLALALSPTPFKTVGESIWSEKDLQCIHIHILEGLYAQYMHFVDMATKKPTELTDDEVEALMGTVKKKPEILKELDRPKLLTVAFCLHHYYEHMEKMHKSDSNS